ncbi:hypothetical protein ONZ45_g9256 [Pleurotus djamor]|nr:hypothetical protein ONZ45_g9256 [Pleurotus djamor]
MAPRNSAEPLNVVHGPLAGQPHTPISVRTRQVKLKREGNESNLMTRLLRTNLILMKLEEGDDDEANLVLVSTAWLTDNGWKDLVRAMFVKGMDIPKTSAEHLLPFPDRLDVWPMRTDKPDQQSIRFMWDEEWSHPHNYSMIIKISEAIKHHGAEHSPRAAEAVANIKEGDRLDAVKKQFKSLVQKWKVKQANLIQQPIVVPVADEEGEVGGEEGVQRDPAEKKGITP